MTETISFAIGKVNSEKKIVYGEVYAPNKIDSYGYFATPEEVERMAYKFMKLDMSKVIDTEHDNVSNGSFPVESFIAREGDPDFREGSWVLAVKITNDEVWEKVQSGELNAFSMEIMAKLAPVVVSFETDIHHFGETSEENDHTHKFFAETNVNGKVIGGRTSTDAGHFHEIKVNSITEVSENHTHRFFVG